MRAESLGCYGNKQIKTPNFDSIAAEGTLFENAYTAHPVCCPSRISMATGWYPHVAGFRSLQNFIDSNSPSFFRNIRESGIYTCISAKNHCFTEDSLCDNFNVIVPYTLPNSDPFQNMYSDESREKYLMLDPPISDEEEQQSDDRRFIEAGKSFIRRCAAENKPFFLYQSLNTPHPTYTTTEEYYHMYENVQIDRRPLSWINRKPDFYKLIRKYRKLDQYDDSTFDRIQQVYWGMISYTDSLLGELIDTLKECGIYEDTTIIIASDHGDFAGDAGLVEKWPSAMDDMMTKIPLIIRRPGCPEKQTISSPVQLFDILPTICDFENIPAKHDHFAVSLRNSVETGFEDSSRLVYCEGGYDAFEPQCFEGYQKFQVYQLLNQPGCAYYPKLQQQQNDTQSVCRTVMQRDARYKLVIRTDGQGEFYDMELDPKEYNNLFYDPSMEELINNRIQKMLNWIIHSSDVTSQVL